MVEEQRVGGATLRSKRAAWKTYKQSRISQYGREAARKWGKHIERGYTQLAETRVSYPLQEPNANGFPDNEYYRADKDGYLTKVIE